MIENLRPFTFNEKLSFGLLALFLPAYLVAAIALLPGSVLLPEDFTAFLLWQLAWFIILAIAAVTALATLFLKPDRHPSHLRMQLGRVLPLATLIIAMLLNSVLQDAFSTRQMQRFVHSHSAGLAGHPPHAVIYRAGIPDGGTAIVRSPGKNPAGLTHGVMRFDRETDQILQDTQRNRLGLPVRLTGDFAARSCPGLTTFAHR